MLKLSTSYSKKIPVEGQEYSSQQFHAAVELELSDALEPAAIKERIHDTFQMVKDAVETELNGKASPQQPVIQITKPAATQPAGKASNKQVKFITDLAGRQGITLSQLNEQVRRQYGVSGPYDLDKKQASALLDTLQTRKAA